MSERVVTRVAHSAEVAERVIALWDRCGGWIPGGAREELAEALGVPDRLVRTPQGIRRDNMLDSIDTTGETYCLLDADGDWWAMDHKGYWRPVATPSAAYASGGVDIGTMAILRNYGINAREYQA